MGGKWTRAMAVGLAMATLSSCSDATAPLHSSVDLARRDWLGSHPMAYTFDVATASSMFPKSGYYHVQVRGGQVVTAADSTGQVAPNFTLTVDAIWDRLLAARAKGELNSALFDRHGIPVESDMGPWPVDGGVHYSVRNFVGK